MPAHASYRSDRLMTDPPALDGPAMDSPALTDGQILAVEGALAEPPRTDDLLARLRASGRFSEAFLRAAERPYRLRVQS